MGSEFGERPSETRIAVVRSDIASGNDHEFASGIAWVWNEQRIWAADGATPADEAASARGSIATKLTMQHHIEINGTGTPSILTLATEFLFDVLQHIEYLGSGGVGGESCDRIEKWRLATGTANGRRFKQATGSQASVRWQDRSARQRYFAIPCRRDEARTIDQLGCMSDHGVSIA